MKTSSAKAKGRRLQNEVVELLKERLGLTDDDVCPAIMGETGADVKLISERAREAFPFSIECKNTERLDLWGAIQQAESNATPDLPPMVVFRRNRSRTYAVLELKKLIRLLGCRGHVGGGCWSVTSSGFLPLPGTRGITAHRDGR